MATVEPETVQTGRVVEVRLTVDDVAVIVNGAIPGVTGPGGIKIIVCARLLRGWPESIRSRKPQADLRAALIVAGRKLRKRNFGRRDCPVRRSIPSEIAADNIA